jgi:HD-like signal output (HDOD) protein/nitrogen-specific signal transduction histidine kinase
LTGIPQAIVSELESLRLPTIPKVLLELLRLVEDDRAALTDLAALVRRDPALSARILTIANSPALRQINEHKTIEQCLVAIGISLLRTIAACLAIQSVFSRSSNQQHYDFKGFWRHSLFISEVAREISITVDYSDIEEVYLSALLHDIGQLLLLGGLGEKYGIILDRCGDEESLLSLETPLLGTNHAAVGAWLIDQWKFSSFMADAVMFHHYSAKEIANAGQLIRIVWAAHVIAVTFNPLANQQENWHPDLLATMSMLNMKDSDISDIYGRASERVSLLAHELGISEESSRTIPHSCLPVPNPAVAIPGNCDQTLAELECRVRDMAILQPLLMNLLKLCSEAEILLSLREASKVLFDLGEPSFLLLNSDRPILSGANILGQPELLQRLEILPDPEQSLAGAAISKKRLLSTFDGEHSSVVSLIDVQIARLLDRDGLLYVPLCSRNNCIGLLVYGLSSNLYQKSQKQTDLITSFAQIAATSIESCRDMHAREQKKVSDIRKEFEQHARKIIHEAGNPLGIIKNYLTIVSDKDGSTDGIRDELGIISEEIDRVSQIVRRLNNPAATVRNTGNLDINNLIDGMMSLYGDSLFTSRGIFIQKNLDPALTPISADRDIVKQILLNIWKNGSEAMKAGGCFVISTRDSVNLNGEYFAEIQMSDSGPGLPHDVVKNIFEPLDPDRKPGHYGIGLSIVESLVEQLNGFIFFHSHPGVGTSFSILLPRAS